jgi:hypothetical protein
MIVKSAQSSRVQATSTGIPKFTRAIAPAGQLLGLTLQQEQPELEEKKSTLLQQVRHNAFHFMRGCGCGCRSRWVGGEVVRGRKGEQMY